MYLAASIILALSIMGFHWLCTLARHIVAHNAVVMDGVVMAGLGDLLGAAFLFDAASVSAKRKSR